MKVNNHSYKRKKNNHKHKNKVKKPKIYYADTNILVNMTYTVIDKRYAICTAVAKKGIESCFNLKDFPNDLGFHPHIELLNTIDELTHNTYIYRLDVDFDNVLDTIDDEDFETPIMIDDIIIIKINEYMFSLGSAEIYDYNNDEDIGYLNEPFDD